MPEHVASLGQTATLVSMQKKHSFGKNCKSGTRNTATCIKITFGPNINKELICWGKEGLGKFSC